MSTIQELTAKLNQAIKIQRQIEALQHQLDAILGGTTSAPKKKVGRPVTKKRTMSPATIAKMRAAQQARWAKINGKSSTKKAAPAKVAPKKKGGMSPETKAKLAAAMKARWEAKKKGASTTGGGKD